MNIKFWHFGAAATLLGGAVFLGSLFPQQMMGPIASEPALAAAMTFLSIMSGASTALLSLMTYRSWLNERQQPK